MEFGFHFLAPGLSLAVLDIPPARFSIQIQHRLTSSGATSASLLDLLFAFRLSISRFHLSQAQSVSSIQSAMFALQYIYGEPGNTIVGHPRFNAACDFSFQFLASVRPGSVRGERKMGLQRLGRRRNRGRKHQFVCGVTNLVGWDLRRQGYDARTVKGLEARQHRVCSRFRTGLRNLRKPTHPRHGI